MKISFARLPRLDVVQNRPREYPPDWYALDCSADIFVWRPSSRLYQKLVKEKRWRCRWPAEATCAAATRALPVPCE